MAFSLSVLDLLTIDPGTNSTQALHNATELARKAEELGYSRYWLGEHHNEPMFACSAPEIMIGHIAQATTHMRVGAGGVMLPNHAPLKVVENFRVLAALYPGRIDLGIGRAPGTDQMTALALRRSQAALGNDDFPEQLAQLFAFSSGGFPDGHLFHTVRAVPTDSSLPPVWLLGSSDSSARTAAALGLSFAFAHHIHPRDAERAMNLYREQFKPSMDLPEPRTIVATSVICADTDECLEELVALTALVLARARSGLSGSLPSLAEALAYTYTPTDLAETVRNQRIMGTPAEVKEQLERLIERTRADELMITLPVYGHENRIHMLELLARAFDLTPLARRAEERAMV